MQHWDSVYKIGRLRMSVNCNANPAHPVTVMITKYLTRDLRIACSRNCSLCPCVCVALSAASNRKTLLKMMCLPVLYVYLLIFYITTVRIHCCGTPFSFCNPFRIGFSSWFSKWKMFRGILECVLCYVLWQSGDSKYKQHPPFQIWFAE